MWRFLNGKAANARKAAGGTKQNAAEKAAPKATSGRKTAANKPAGKKSAAKKPAAKAAGKKPQPKKAAARTSAKKTATKPAAKTAAKKAQPKKTAGKPAAKSAGKKPAAKSPGKKPAAAAGGAGGAGDAVGDSLTQQRLPLVWRVLILLVAFVAMVAFAVVLSKLTLGPSAASESLVHSNLRPGDSIRAYLAQPAIQDTLKQLGGNIVLGVPFGVLLPALVPRTRGLLRVMAATAAVMLLVELVQGALVQGRAFDIDDVILNTTGAMLGYLILGRRIGLAVHPRRRHWWHRRAGNGTSAAASRESATPQSGGSRGASGQNARS
jgi:glycopeptide antibiotics resistance protein